MRQGTPNKRLRSRSRKSPSPLSRVYESNGPDVKIRGSAQQVADKYVQLSRDAQSAGDRVMAENYMQHAEHYYRIVAAAQPQSNVREDRDEDRDEAFRDRDEQPREIRDEDSRDGGREGDRLEARRNGAERERGQGNGAGNGGDHAEGVNGFRANGHARPGNGAAETRTAEEDRESEAEPEAEARLPGIDAEEPAAREQSADSGDGAEADEADEGGQRRTTRRRSRSTSTTGRTRSTRSTRSRRSTTSGDGDTPKTEA